MISLHLCARGDRPRGVTFPTATGLFDVRVPSKSFRDPIVVRRALRTAVLVGLVLTAINHGPALWRGDVTAGRLAQIALTFVVPYVVSSTSSVAARRDTRH